MVDINEQLLISKLDKELRVIYYAYKLLQQMGGNGSIEVHFVQGEIREKNGLYLKPGINNVAIDVMRQMVENDIVDKDI